MRTVTDWRSRQAAHESRVDALLAAHLDRRSRGQAHPVEDFLFTYYSYRPAQLRRWHPGHDVVLPPEAPHAEWTGYVADSTGVRVDPRVRERKRSTIDFVLALQTAIGSRPPALGCLGLHEWAMVYQQPAQEVRHGSYPLRLGAQGTDDVVRAHRIRCTHHDAFRFFTAAARPRNTLQPTREQQVALDQPGCLHVGMDLYKWASKLSPLVPSELVLDCFELAHDIRALDMRASPYDLRDLGYEPVRIETAEGKAEYVVAQRGFTERAAPLRQRLIEAARSCSG